MSRVDSLLEQLQAYSSQIFMEADGVSHTYAELLSEKANWRRRFDEWNITPATVVAVRADYSLSAVAVLLALAERRAVAALIPLTGNTDIYIADSHAVALLDLGIDGSYQWHAVEQATVHPLLESLRNAGESGLVIFTSGSTGRPKAALQSLERYLRKFGRPRPGLRTLAFMLLDHVSGLDLLFYALINGSPLILTRRRDPRSIMELIESQKVELISTSPSFLRLLCAAGEGSDCDLSSLKHIYYGSEPMDSSTLARLVARFPNAQFRQRYGTTETGSPESSSRGKDSLWLKIKNESMETRVVDGILWVRSPSTMLGYLNAQSPIDEEGWYCTGDLVETDGEWLKFRGRAVEIINVGGEKVAPLEVEQSIMELDFVRDALVAGEPHPLMGQMVTARVRLTPTTADMDHKVAAKRIRSHCRERLASYKVPIKVDIVTDGFTNARQKAQRRRDTPSPPSAATGQ